MKTNDKPVKINIYADIDSIIDTRLPIIFEFDEDLATELVRSKKYHNRVNDIFGYIPQNLFKILYNNRSKMVLKQGTPTPVIPLINKYNIEARLAANSSGGDTDTILYLNTYPYYLLSDELDNIVTGLKASIPNINVKPIFEKPTAVTPEWIDKNVAIMFMYDGLEWIERHIANHNIIKTPLSNIVMIVPSLLYNSVRYSAKDKADILNMFENVQKTYGTLMRVKFVDTEIFCTLL